MMGRSPSFEDISGSLAHHETFVVIALAASLSRNS